MKCSGYDRLNSTTILHPPRWHQLVIPAKASWSFPRRPAASFPRRRESTIAAHAGIQRKETPSRPTSHRIPTQDQLNVRITSTSFPRRRESTIAAHAGIQRKETPSRPTSHRIPTQDQLNVRITSTSFPRRQESTNPAYAGVFSFPRSCVGMYTCLSTNNRPKAVRWFPRRSREPENILFPRRPATSFPPSRE